MDEILKVYVTNKVVDFIRKNIYKLEITEKGKTGVQKFQKLTDNLWEKAEKWIELEKQRDITWIPDILESVGENTIYEVIKVLREELDIKKLAQEIFDIEKSENAAIF